MGIKRGKLIQCNCPMEWEVRDHWVKWEDVAPFIGKILPCNYDKCIANKERCHNCLRNSNYTDLYDEG